MTSEPRAQFRQTGGLTALLYATRSGCYRCAVAIVKAGADVNQPNPDGITPLINAIDNRSFDIANVPARQGRQPEYLGHERPHAPVCRGGHGLLPRARTLRGI